MEESRRKYVIKMLSEAQQGNLLPAAGMIIAAVNVLLAVINNTDVNRESLEFAVGQAKVGFDILENTFPGCEQHYNRILEQVNEQIQKFDEETMNSKLTRQDVDESKINEVLERLANNFKAND